MIKNLNAFERNWTDFCLFSLPDNHKSFNFVEIDCFLDHNQTMVSEFRRLFWFLITFYSSRWKEGDNMINL